MGVSRVVMSVSLYYNVVMRSMICSGYGVDTGDATIGGCARTDTKATFRRMCCGRRLEVVGMARARLFLSVRHS